MEPEADIVELLHPGAVDQDVDAVEHTVGDLGMVTSARHKLVERVTRKAPDALRGRAGLTPREAIAHALEKVHKTELVLGLHGLAAEHSEAVAERVVQALYNLVLNLAGEGLARLEAPRTRVEASRASTAATGDKERRAHSLAVGDV